MRHTIAVLLALTLVATAPVGGRQTTDVQTGRLATLGRVWLAVKFAHPRVALTSRDWDAVLTGAVSAVKSATDDRSFDAAIEGMLRTLDDPVTRVISSAEPPAPMAGAPARPAFSSLPAGALLIDLRAPAVLNDAAAVREAIAANLAAITKADRMIVDIRGARQNPFMAERTFDAFNELLISTPTALPAARVVRHAGYRAQAGGASFYGSEVVTESAVLVKPREGMAPRRVAFIVDRLAMVPPIALALRAAGAGAIVAVGESPATPVRSMTVPVGAKSMATIRVSDFALAGRRTELDVDAALAGSESDQRVYARAAELIAAARPAVPGIEDPFPLWQPEPAYDTTPFPSEPLRLLAVYRLWVRRNTGVAVAYHAREHGLTDRPGFVLVQGRASFDPEPDRAWLESITPEWDRFLGPRLGGIRGRMLDVYYWERVAIEIQVERIVSWPETEATGMPAIYGAPRPAGPPPQKPPKGGTGPRESTEKVVAHIERLPHTLLGWCGADGMPEVAPVTGATASEDGVELEVPAGTVPEGGRRAGLTSHWFKPRMVGQEQRIHTGWVEAGEARSSTRLTRRRATGCRLRRRS